MFGLTWLMSKKRGFIKKIIICSFVFFFGFTRTNSRIYSFYVKYMNIIYLSLSMTNLAHSSIMSEITATSSSKTGVHITSFASPKFDGNKFLQWSKVCTTVQNPISK